MSSATEHLLGLPPYGVDPAAKRAALLAAVREELAHHVGHCPPYARWCARQGFDPSQEISDLADVPFLPANIFKRMFLSSVPESQVVRVLATSATSSQTPGRVPLDQTTRNRQMKALAAVLSHRIGGQRRPFLVLDAPPEGAAAGDMELSARVAGMRGYLLAATEREYVLNREGGRLLLDREKLSAVVGRWAGEGKPFCLLGYTYVLYENVVRPLLEEGIRLDLPASTFVIHFGGWKRLREQAISKEALNARCGDVFGLPPAAIVDVYGFTEQLGVIYPDAADGLKHVPTWAEVFVRNPRTLAVVPRGATGLLEFISPLPHSYPGVAVLLDDLGRVIDAPPGHEDTGTAFEIVGRAPRAEVRGCGDTYGGNR